MPKVSEEHRQARRAEILAAAFACFDRKGFHLTTMRDICRQAGLSPGAVYSYFDGKDAIVEALAEPGHRSLREFLSSLGTETSAPATLVRAVETITSAQLSAEGRAVTGLDIRLWGEALDNPTLRKLFHVGFESSSGAIAEQVEGGRERGEVDVGFDPQSVACVAIATIMGLGVVRAMGFEDEAAKGVEAFTRLLKQGLAAEERRS